MKTFSSLLFFCILLTARSQVINHTIYFDSGKSSLKPNDAAWLDSISGSLKNMEKYSIDIKAYCDADGSDESNAALSGKRVFAIKEKLFSVKLNEAAIVSNSFGENNPVSDNTTSAGRALNRRAVITINYSVPQVIQQEKPKLDIPAIPLAKSKSVMPEKAISEEKLEVGKTLILKNLNFEGGTPILLAQSEPVLKDLLKLMHDNPTLEIEIGGHVCCGPDYELSLERAKKVYNYLKNYGIDEKRMTYKGYSFDKPIASERTEEGKTANRRVEITILKL